MTRYILFLFTAVCLFSCGKPAPETKAEAKVPEKVVPQTSYKYKLSPFSASTEYSAARITSMKYAAGKFAFGVKDYALGAQTPDAKAKNCANSGKGQHIHLIVDNSPYAAKYTADFAHDVPDGEHHILAFLSRSYHESIKTDAAHTAQKVTVKNKSITQMDQIDEPMLFYSRPKGTYTGKAETEKVMLDFFPINLTLGNEYTVKATINGEDQVLKKWQPYYIEGLPLGENTITLTLLKNGKKANVPLNPVSRTFVLKGDVLED